MARFSIVHILDLAMDDQPWSLITDVCVRKREKKRLSFKFLSCGSFVLRSYMIESYSNEAVVNLNWFKLVTSNGVGKYENWLN